LPAKRRNTYYFILHEFLEKLSCGVRGILCGLVSVIVLALKLQICRFSLQVGDDVIMAKGEE